MPDNASFPGAAGLVIAAVTAYQGLVNRGLLQSGETALITAAAGGVGSAAVQIASTLGARPMGVASPANHDYLRGLGASDVFDYHAPDWVQQVRAIVTEGVDLVFDCVGGPTGDQAVGAVRDGGRAISVIPPFGHRELERGISSDSFAATGSREMLETLSRMVDAGQLRPHVEGVLPLDQVREALRRVASRHTRGKVVLQIGQ
jgi:NADPH2:quinone reductase